MSPEEVRQKIEEFLETFVREPTKPNESTTLLVSPWTVKKLGEILGVNVAKEGNQVPNIKTFLRVFLLQFRLDQGINPADVESCIDMVHQERLKHREVIRERKVGSRESVQEAEDGQIYCVECGLDAEKYCVDCAEASCADCCGRLHAKGHRAKHTLNSIINCSLCKRAPAKVLCTYTFRPFCGDCYSRRHLKSIPHAMLDLAPVKIDYSLRTTTPHVPTLQHEVIETAGVTEGSLVNKKEDDDPFHRPGADWHPFLDYAGVVYYYNFQLQESKRRAHPEDPHVLSENDKQATKRIATFLSQ